MPTIPEALAIAVQHHEAGQLQAAEQIYRQILVAEPNQFDALHLLGVVASQQGKHEAAVEFIQRAIGLQGNAAHFHNSLGEVFRALGRDSEAVASYRQALKLKPDYAEAHSNLGNALRSLGNHEEAVACYRRAVELKPDFAVAQNNLGKALKDLRRLEEAIGSHRRAMEVKPNLVETLGNLGNAFAEKGDFKEAEHWFRTALQHNPRFAFAHHKLAELLGGKLPDADLAAQHRLLDDAGLTDSERMLLHYGLAWVLDGRGEYAEAAKHVDRANALQLSERTRCGKTYDPQDFESVVSRMIAVCSPEFFESRRAGTGFGSESELPVFVVGLPRSGTTLIEQILASHSQVYGAGEIPFAQDTMAELGGEGGDTIYGLSRLNRQTADRLAARHLQRLRELHPTALRIVDKMPENYLLLGLLAGLFPRARFIHCRRDVRDVAVSCWMTYFRELRWACDQEQIALRIRGYQRMMDHWRQVLPMPLVEVDYEETVSDLEGVARRLIAACGLEWEPGCLDFHRSKRQVSTASLVQVRQAVFQESVQRWKHYETHLASLLSAVERESPGL